MSTSRTSDASLKGYESNQTQMNLSLLQRNMSPSGERRGRGKQAEPGSGLSHHLGAISSHIENPSDMSAYGSPQDDNFFFSNDSNSGYLECIVQDNCFRKSNASASSHDLTIGHVNSNSMHVQPHFDTTQEALNMQTTVTSNYADISYPSQGLWNNQQSWDCSSNELAAMFKNPSRAEEGYMCMNALMYPFTDSSSYGFMTQAEAVSSTTFSPSLPPFGDADLGYSPF
ncbi:hypothetical protein JHK87_036873 [Glycine soja]|nr:hypothetical protein JHK87_036873 [Glycine soja]